MSSWGSLAIAATMNSCPLQLSAGALLNSAAKFMETIWQSNELQCSVVGLWLNGLCNRVKVTLCDYHSKSLIYCFVQSGMNSCNDNSRPISNNVSFHYFKNLPEAHEVRSLLGLYRVTRKVAYNLLLATVYDIPHCTGQGRTGRKWAEGAVQCQSSMGSELWNYVNKVTWRFPL